MPRTRVFTRSKPFQPSSSASSKDHNHNNNNNSHHNNNDNDNHNTNSNKNNSHNNNKYNAQPHSYQPSCKPVGKRNQQNGTYRRRSSGSGIHSGHWACAESQDGVEMVHSWSNQSDADGFTAAPSFGPSPESTESSTIKRTNTPIIDIQITNNQSGRHVSIENNDDSNDKQDMCKIISLTHEDDDDDDNDEHGDLGVECAPLSHGVGVVHTVRSPATQLENLTIEISNDQSYDSMPGKGLVGVRGRRRENGDAAAGVHDDGLTEHGYEPSSFLTAAADNGGKRRKKPRRRSKRTRPSPSPSDEAVTASVGVLPNVNAHNWDADSGVDMCSQSSSALSSGGGDSPHGHHASWGSGSPSSDDRLASFSEESDSYSGIPFYFKEPDLDPELVLSNENPLPWSLDDLRDGDDSVFSWSEFDVSQNDAESTQCPNGCIDSDLETFSELSVGIADISLSRTSADVNNVGCVNTDQEEIDAQVEGNFNDSCSTEAETDYDSFLPEPVLMYVKRDLVSVLMEYGQTREVKVSFTDMARSGPHHASKFHTSAVVDGREFPVGSGSSKKNAKKAAAAFALQMMYEEGKRHLENVNVDAHRKLLSMTDEEVGSHAHRVVLVSRHVLDTCEETQFINYSKDKIAATFVLEHNGKMKVVGLGTGNRCILYQHLATDGQRIIHAHAEIMARRAFLRFLYKQLLTYDSRTPHPVFTKSDTGKLKLRDKIQVHLYISRPPCGDAAAFPTISNFPNRMRAIRKQGQLRTIIDDGEGAIPTDFTLAAGANGKERLRIMTCSDKICRWNVLGVQGALLSHFMDPIYLSSVVIGSHTGDQRGHVPRAISGRLKCGRLHEVIQRPYRLNSPEIHYPHDDLSDTYNITKSKQYCITWTLGDDDAEVIDAITGIVNMENQELVMKSRVSKASLSDLFQQVCHKYGREELTAGSYAKAKRYATTFQRMKSFVGQHLVAMGFGQWYSLQETYGTDDFAWPASSC